MQIRQLAASCSIALAFVTSSGCALRSDESSLSEDGAEPDSREAELAKLGVDCSTRRTQTGYRKGTALTITVVDVDGKPVEISTAAAYLKMQKAAASDGVAVRVVSGFRTNAEQKTLYQAYLDGTGNLAAKPGYSNHQSGHALDLNRKGAGVQNWLDDNGSDFGFKRTVSSEPWHWEYWGASGDPCAPSTKPTTDPPSTPTTPPATPGEIWHPKPGTTWQWQLAGTIDTSIAVQMYDVDVFDTPRATIDALHSKGRKVVCYFSGGTREDWRSDASAFKSSDYGSPVSGWAGERWLDVRSANVRAIMKNRLDLATAKKCDGVEPDNVDGHDNSTGFSLTRASVIDYNRFLVREAHARGLSIGLKNALDLVTTLVSEFDWALNEQCLAFSECSLLHPFLDAGKAVFHVEYVASESAGPAKHSTVCANATRKGFSTLIKKQNDSIALDAWRLACE